MCKNYLEMRDKRNNTLYPLLMAKPITEFLRDAYGILVKDMQEEGIVINPWGQSFLLTKDLIKLLLQVSKEGSAT